MKTILCVDDDPDMCAFVKTVLEDKGFEVLEANDVAQGMKLALTRFPELVITDVMMPGESGYGLCAKLKADPTTADIPILVVTILEDEQRALDAGATAFLSKPLEVASLTHSVEMILDATDTRELFNQALKKFRAGKVDECRLAFLKLIETDPRGSLSKWARYYVGQIEMARGGGAESIKLFEDILDQDPQFWRAHNRLGLHYEHQGDRHTAIRHYQRSLSLNANQDDLAHKVESMNA